MRRGPRERGSTAGLSQEEAGLEAQTRTDGQGVTNPDKQPDTRRSITRPEIQIGPRDQRAHQTEAPGRGGSACQEQGCAVASPWAGVTGPWGRLPSPRSRRGRSQRGGGAGSWLAVPCVECGECRQPAPACPPAEANAWRGGRGQEQAGCPGPPPHTCCPLMGGSGPGTGMGRQKGLGPQQPLGATGHNQPYLDLREDWPRAAYLLRSEGGFWEENERGRPTPLRQPGARVLSAMEALLRTARTGTQQVPTTRCGLRQGASSLPEPLFSRDNRIGNLCFQSIRCI